MDISYGIKHIRLEFSSEKQGKKYYRCENALKAIPMEIYTAKFGLGKKKIIFKK